MRRWAWEKRVVDSNLPAPVRHLLLTLAVVADWPAGETSKEHTPSLTTLTKKTGMGRSTIARALTVAEDAGWLARQRPTVANARADKERTTYKLTDPSSPRAGLVTGPTAGLASATAGPELVPERDGGLVPERDTSQKRSPETTSSSRAGTAEATIQERTGATIDEAATVADAIRRERPDIRSLVAVLRHFTDEELAERVAAVRGDTYRHAIREFLDWAGTQPECDDFVAGGDLLRPDTNLPVCVACRKRKEAAR